MNKLLVGAACALALASIVSAQQMTFIVADGHWQALSNSFLPETSDPMGQIWLDGSKVNTFATSNGDHCEASGHSRDTVVNGPRLVQTATAIGFHTAEWEHVGPGNGEVELNQSAGVDGTVTIVNGTIEGTDTLVEAGLPAAATQQMGVVIGTPLAGGLFADAPRRTDALANLASEEMRQAFWQWFHTIEALPGTVPQHAYRWILADPRVSTVSSGAATVAELAEVAQMGLR